MSVHFNEQTTSFSEEEKGLVGFLLTKGIAKNKTQANKILFFAALLCILIIIVLRWPEAKGEALSPEKIDGAGSTSEILNT